MIRIIADTTSVISTQEAEKLGVPYLPQIIVFGEESYRDDNELDTETFLKKLTASPVLPKTAAPPPALYTPIYEQYVSSGDTLIVICPSAEVSGTVRSASIAAKDFPDADIRVVDTRTIAAGLGSIVRQAVAWVKEGLDADTLVQRIENLGRRNRIFFYVNTLEFLYKGGRIGGAQALFGSLLQVKPLLTFVNGRVEPLETQRTKKRAFSRLEELVLKECPRSEDSHLEIMEVNARDDANQIIADLKTSLGVSEIPIRNLPPAIIVHGGPGIIAISFFSDKIIE